MMFQNLANAVRLSMSRKSKKSSAQRRQDFLRQVHKPQFEKMEERTVFDATPFDLSTGSFTQDWSDTGMITTDGDWSGVPSIIGYRGDGLTAVTGTDPQTLLMNDSPGVVNVIANQANPDSFASGAVVEFDGIPNPTIALNGSGTADAPYIQIHLNTLGRENVTISYNLRDLDGSGDNATQQYALHYRVGNTGDFTNVPEGYVADATTGGTADQVTAVNVTLPAAVNNFALVQLRIMTTNAGGNDESVGIDDIVVSSSEVTGNTPPSVVTNTGLSVPTNLVGTPIDMSRLNSTDAEQAPASRTYTIVTAPANGGIVRLSGAVVPVGGTFTQAQVDAGLVTYDAAASAGDDSFVFSLSDGFVSTADTPFTITVNAAAEAIAPTILSFEDDDADDTVDVGTTVIYTITFDEPLNPFSISAADFINSGTAAVTFGALTLPTASSVSFPVTATGPGTIILQIPSGVVIQDTEGNALAVPATDDTTITVTPPPVNTVTINEVDSDTPGTDTAEFIELYNNSPTPFSLDNYFLVLYNGSTDGTYLTQDLSGNTIPANGFFVIGGAEVPTVNLILADGFLQNGADAVALFRYSGGPPGTGVFPASAANALPANFELLDAVVYDTSDADDLGLLDALTPGQPQIDEGGGPNGSGNDSIARVPDGGTALDTTTFVAQAPTPGATNVPPDVTPPTVTFDDGDADDVVNVNSTLLYTLTFDEDVDATTIAFDNLGTAAITIGTITQTSPTTVTVEVTPTTAGTIILQIPTGTLVEDTAGNDLVVPVSDDTTVNANPLNNDPPVVTVNLPLTVAEGATGIIDETFLAATDDTDVPSTLTYTIIAQPANGQLLLNGLPIVAPFTQADIDNDLLTYVHGGGELASDSFTFTVTDSEMASSGTQTFSIVVTPVNDAPLLTTNAGLTATYSTINTITTALLEVTDVDNTPAEITYTLTALSTGTLSKSGVPLALSETFTQEDINNGAITYTAPASGASDSFDFTVSDGAGGSIATSTFAITLLEAPVLLINEVYFNPPGSDSGTGFGNEFVELRGTPGYVIPAGTYLVGIEGDASTLGDVQNIFDVSGLTFGTNGLILILQKDNSYDTSAAIADGTTVLVNTGTSPGWGNGGSSSIGHSGDGGNDIENASVTFMLLQSGTAPTLTDDIDIDNDGVPDGAVYAGWNILDSIGILDNSAAGDFSYAPVNFINSTGFGASTTGVTVAIGSTAGYVARLGTSTSNTPADWLAGDTTGTVPNFTLLTGNGAGISDPSLRGAAINTIGLLNTFVPVAPTDIDLAGTSVDENQPIGTTVGTFSTVDPTTGDTFTYTLEAGIGDTDNALFTISPTGELLTNASLNFEAQETYSILVRSTDAQGNSLDEIFTITALDVNDAPVALGNTVTTLEDTAYTFSDADFFFSDEDLDTPVSVTVNPLATASGTLTYLGVPVTAPVTIDVANLSDLVFTPAENDFGIGANSFTYTVNDADFGTVAGTLSIDVTNVNDVPTAINSSVTTDEDVPYTFAAADFLFSDVDGDQLASITLISLPSSGTLLLGGQTVTIGQIIAVGDIPTLVYTPEADLSGTALATFDFTVNDGIEDSAAPATMTINVNAVNDLPEATGNTVTTDEDIAYTFLLTDFPFTDVEGDDLASITISGLSLAGGTLTLDGTPITSTTEVSASEIAAGDLVYTPAENANGTGLASFSYTVNDTEPGTISAILSIDVTPVNDLPIASSNTVTTPEDISKTFAVADFTFTDVENDALVSVTITNLSLNGGTLLLGTTAVTEGQVITAIEIPTLVYAPPANANGSPFATFDFSVNDGSGNSSVATMTIDVTAVNDAPVAEVSAVTTDEDTAYAFESGDFLFTDVESDALVSITIQSLALSGGTLLFGGSPVTTGLTIPAASISTLIYTPPLNANGTPFASFTFTADDASPGTVAATMTINVTAVNDVPSFVIGPTRTVNEDSGAQTFPGQATAISAGASDEIGQTLTFIVSNDNTALFTAGGQPAISDSGVLTFTPALDAFGSALVTVSLSDGSLTSATQTFTINLTAVNDPPSFTKGDDQTVLEDAGPQSVTGWATNISTGPANENGQMLSFFIETTNDALFSVLPVINPATGMLTYTPALDAFGSATVTVTLLDNGGGTNSSPSQTFDINVTAVNDLPTFTLPGNPNQSVDANSGLNTVTGFATGISAGPANEGQTPTFDVTNDNSTLFSVQPSIDPTTGNLTYTLAADQTGTAIVSVTLSDGIDTTAVQQFTITVNSVVVGPTVTVVAPLVTVPGLVRTYAFNVTNPTSPTAQYTFTINWGDGTPIQTVTGVSGTKVTRTYIAKGNRTISVTARDSNNLTGAPTTKVVQVKAAAVIARVLYVGGTNARDIISLTPVTAANGKTIRVKQGALILGTFTNPAKAVVFGLGGNDNISIVAGRTATNRPIKPNVPVQFLGGAGNDVLSAAANAARSTLVGGTGGDILTGSAARDILIGGVGADRISGNGGDDIVIAGRTNYDANLVALDRLMATWGNTALNYATRVRRLSTGTLSPTTPKLRPQTVKDDKVIDTIAGQVGQDWFFASTVGTKKDRLTGKAANETVTRIV